MDSGDALSPYVLTPEREEDQQAIRKLQDLALGSGRFTRGASKLRSALEPLREFAYVIRYEQELVGSIQYTAVHIGKQNGLMLGPLVIHPEHMGRGQGGRLLRKTLDIVKDSGYPWVVLVGSQEYYSRFRAFPLSDGRVFLRGDVEPLQILFFEFVPGAVDPLFGEVKPGHFADFSVGRE